MHERVQGFLVRMDAVLQTGNIWTNRFGIARTVIAAAQLVTLLLSSVQDLWVPVPVLRGDLPPYCDANAASSLFCVVPSLEWSRWLAIVGFALVASGWRPRVTGFIHAYLAWSCFVGFTMPDGGDQVAALIAAMLLPACIADDRVWHWQRRTVAPERAQLLAGWGTTTLVRVQASIIYAHACMGKLAVEEWANGTVLYYWLTHLQFGAPSWLQPIVRPLVLSPVMLPLMTWGVLLAEFVLAAGLLASVRAKAVLLRVGLLLHAGIIVLHGITSFSIIMMGLLVLYLSDLTKPVAFGRPVPSSVPERSEVVLRPALSWRAW